MSLNIVNYDNIPLKDNFLLQHYFLFHFIEEKNNRVDTVNTNQATQTFSPVPKTSCEQETQTTTSQYVNDLYDINQDNCRICWEGQLDSRAIWVGSIVITLSALGFVSNQGTSYM